MKKIFWFFLVILVLTSPKNSSAEEASSYAKLHALMPGIEIEVLPPDHPRPVNNTFAIKEIELEGQKITVVCYRKASDLSKAKKEGCDACRHEAPLHVAFCKGDAGLALLLDREIGASYYLGKKNWIEVGSLSDQGGAKRVIGVFTAMAAWNIQGFLFLYDESASSVRFIGEVGGEDFYFTELKDGSKIAVSSGSKGTLKLLPRLWMLQNGNLVDVSGNHPDFFKPYIQYYESRLRKCGANFGYCIEIRRSLIHAYYLVGEKNKSFQEGKEMLNDYRRKISELENQKDTESKVEKEELEQSLRWAKEEIAQIRLNGLKAFYPENSKKTMQGSAEGFLKK